MDNWMDRMIEEQNERERQWRRAQEKEVKSGREQVPGRLGGKHGSSFV